MGNKGTVVPLGLNSRVTGSNALVPIFMYNGSPYVQTGNSLRPVEPSYKTTKNGSVVNAPLINANWHPHGPKLPNAYNINYSAGSPLVVPTSSTVLSNANAAAFLRELNVPAVPVANITMKPVNNQTAIPISGLPTESKEVIAGTTLLEKLKSVTNRLRSNKSQKAIAQQMFPQVQNLPKNSTSIDAYVTKLQACPGPQKFEKFLSSLPQGKLNNTGLNWNAVATKAELSQEEVTFFRNVLNDTELRKVYNSTIQSLPKNKTNTFNRKNKIFAAIWAINTAFSLATLVPVIASGGAAAGPYVAARIVTRAFAAQAGIPLLPGL